MAEGRKHRGRGAGVAGDRVSGARAAPGVGATGHTETGPAERLGRRGKSAQTELLPAYGGTPFRAVAVCDGGSGFALRPGRPELGGMESAAGARAPAGNCYGGDPRCGGQVGDRRPGLHPGIGADRAGRQTEQPGDAGGEGDFHRSPRRKPGGVPDRGGGGGVERIGEVRHPPGDRADAGDRREPDPGPGICGGGHRICGGQRPGGGHGGRSGPAAGTASARRNSHQPDSGHRPRFVDSPGCGGSAGQ